MIQYNVSGYASGGPHVERSDRRLRSRTWPIVGLLLAIAACGSSTGGPKPTASLSGVVRHGGSAISQAIITLYGASDDGPRMRPTRLGGALSDDDGAFTIRYAAPADVGVLYVIASGGNVGQGYNAAIELMGIAGLSHAVPDALTLNELTTAASAWALAQFASSNGRDVGTSSTNAVGLQNAVALAQTNLVDSVTGAAAGFWPPSAQCSGPLPPANCEGLERLNTLANILAACVASSGASSPACRRLFSSTGASQTTLQAAHAIVTNPARNASALFELSQGNELYAPVLGGAPDAWTLALKYVGNGAEFDGPGDMAVDRDGNVWATNNYVFNSDPLQPTCGGKQVIELTPTGADAPGAPFSGGGVDGAGFGIAIDKSDNVWVANFGFSGDGCESPPPADNVSKFTAAGAPLSPSAGFTQGSLDGSQGTVVDQAGDLWFANYHGNSVTKYPGGDPAAAVNFADIGLDTPFDAAIDDGGNVWITSFGNDLVFKLDPNGALVTTPFSGGGLSKPLGLAIDSLGNVWIANNSGNSVTMLDSDGTADPGSPFGGGGLDLPSGVAVDGNDHVWVVNFTGMNERLTELCGARTSTCPAELHTGDPISPSTGYTSTTLMRLTGVVIDSSGNLWVADNRKSDPIPTNPGGDGLVEFVGLAGPVKVPLLGPPQQP